MVRRISFALANYIYNKEKTSHSARYAYYYIIQLILFQIAETAILLIFAFMFNCVKETIIVILMFTQIRRRIGGFHASTQRNCIIISSISIVGTGYISKLICNYYNTNFMIVTILMAITMVLIMKCKIGNIVLKRIDSGLNKIYKQLKIK